MYFILVVQLQPSVVKAGALMTLFTKDVGAIVNQAAAALALPTRKVWKASQARRTFLFAPRAAVATQSGAHVFMVTILLFAQLPFIVVLSQEVEVA